MPLREVASLALNGVAVVLLLVTVIVYYRQLRTMQGQLAAAQQAATMQNLMHLVDHLQRKDIREARVVAITQLRSKNMADWSEADQKAASLVCSSYVVAGMTVRLGGVPATAIIDTWGQSIRLCYNAVRPWIEEMQKSENAGPAYWDHFVWLNSQVRASESMPVTAV